MPNHHIPRICLFGWLPQTRPFHGLRDDLSSLGVSDGEWHDKASDRVRWKVMWSQYSYTVINRNLNRPGL